MKKHILLYRISTVIRKREVDLMVFSCSVGPAVSLFIFYHLFFLVRVQFQWNVTCLLIIKSFKHYVTIFVNHASTHLTPFLRTVKFTKFFTVENILLGKGHNKILRVFHLFASYWIFNEEYKTELFALAALF